MDIESGDLLALKRTSPNWFNRATSYVTGARHHHDELVCRHGDRLHVGCAHAPYFEMLPLRQRFDEFVRGEIKFAVYRFSDIPKMSRAERIRFQLGIDTYVRALSLRKLPYDRVGVLTIARNVVRKALHLPLSGWQTEYKVWCTESCFQGLHEVGGLDIYRTIGKQSMPAPIHVERLVRCRDLGLVYDGGLHEELVAP